MKDGDISDPHLRYHNRINDLNSDTQASSSIQTTTGWKLAARLSLAAEATVHMMISASRIVPASSFFFSSILMSVRRAGSVR